MPKSRHFARCNWPGVGTFAAGYGAQALDFLRDKSREDPWWAVESIIMHAGRVNYNSQQPVIDEMVQYGPQAVESLDAAIGTAARVRRKMGRGAQDWARIAAALPVGAACYRRFCELGRCADWKGGKLAPDGEKLIECMRSGEYVFSNREIDAAKRAPSHNPRFKSLFDSMVEQKVIVQRGGKWLRKGTGIGAKSRNLMAEYIGCDKAVAVDTHVANWVSQTGRLVWVQPMEVLRFDKLGRPICARGKDGKCRRNKKGEPIQARHKVNVKTRWAKNKKVIDGLRKSGYHVTTTLDDKQFAMFKREFQNMAEVCGVAPADLQVGAWAQGTCTAVSDGRRYGAAVEGGIYLGKGRRDSCSRVPAFEAATPTGDAVRLAELPGVPAKKFVCKTGYFGNFDEDSKGAGSRFKLRHRLPKPPPEERWKPRPVGGGFPARQPMLQPGVFVSQRQAQRPRAFAGAFPSVRR